MAAAIVLVAGCGGPSPGGGSDRGEASAERGSPSPSPPGGTLILGTTTSTQDSGLLDTLVPAYESGSRCQVKTVAVGSGEALAMGAGGTPTCCWCTLPPRRRRTWRRATG